VLEVLKVLADKRLAAGTVQEEVLEAVHRTVREEVLEARRTGLEVVRHTGLEVVRHTGLDVARQVQCDVAEVVGNPAEDGHRIDRVEGLEEDLRSLPGTAGLVVGRSQVDRSLAVGVLRYCQSEACMPEFISFADTHEEAGHSLVEELCAVD
jgi:hypothetical protein